MSVANCLTCELTAARDAGTAPLWDCIHRTAHWDVVHSEFVARLGATVWSVNQMSLRQQITPVSLFARATAARRVLLFGMQIVGAALGGVLGSGAGPRATLLVGAAVMLTSVLLIWRSPVRAAVAPAGEDTRP